MSQGRRIDSHATKDFRTDVLFVSDYAQQQMLSANVSLFHLPCFIHCQLDDPLRTLSQFEAPERYRMRPRSHLALDDGTNFL